jgi:hypothetical protein
LQAPATAGWAAPKLPAREIGGSTTIALLPIVLLPIVLDSDRTVGRLVIACGDWWRVEREQECVGSPASG